MFTFLLVNNKDITEHENTEIAATKKDNNNNNDKKAAFTICTLNKPGTKN